MKSGLLGRNAHEHGGTPKGVLTEDAVGGIMECISKFDLSTGEKRLHPGQLVLAIERIQAVIDEHPEEFAGKNLNSMDVFLMMPRYDVDLSPDALAKWRDSLSKEDA